VPGPEGTGSGKWTIHYQRGRPGSRRSTTIRSKSVSTSPLRRWPRTFHIPDLAPALCTASLATAADEAQEPSSGPVCNGQVKSGGAGILPARYRLEACATVRDGRDMVTSGVSSSINGQRLRQSIPPIPRYVSGSTVVDLAEWFCYLARVASICVPLPVQGCAAWKVFGCVCREFRTRRAAIELTQS
jgi:hypothetical protein